MDKKQQLGTIASHVLKALGSFRDLETSLTKLVSSSESANSTNSIDLKTQLENDFLRFKMWAGNQAAHQTGPSSLDHRLREAPHLHEQVIYLLKDICESLQDAISLATEDFPFLDRDGLGGEKQEEQNTEPSPHSLNDDDDDDNDSDFSNLDNNSSTISSLSIFFTDVGEAIDCLLRLSVAIANPAPHERFRKLGAGLDEDVSFYEPHDIAYVKDKFPHIDDSLANIIGKFITRRRQFFKYRRAHHTRLAFNLESAVSDEKTDTSRTEIVQKTIASSIPENFKVMVNFDPRANIIDEDVRSDTGISQTSYATSAGFLIENQDDRTRDLPPPIRVPPVPNAGEDGIFECPFCYRMIAAKSRAAWKRHVFGDLRPFTCLFSQCAESNVDFDRWHNWQLHVSRYHWCSWYCPFKCDGFFPSATELTLHVKDKHLPTGDEQELRTVVSLGKKAASADITNQCLVCGSTVRGFKKYIKHVGRHLEQLVLFALPSLEEQSPAEDPASDEQISARSSLDMSSQSSSQAGFLILEGEEMSLPGEEEEEVEEDLSSMGDNSRIQIPNLSPPPLVPSSGQLLLEKFVQSLVPPEYRLPGWDSSGENFGGIEGAAATPYVSISKEDRTKIVRDKIDWFSSQLASIVTPKMELVEGLELEARRLESTPSEGLSREDNLQMCGQMVQILRQVVHELKMFQESHDLSELSPEETTLILEQLTNYRRNMETKLGKLELSFANAKANGTDQTEDLNAEDSSEMSARLADLEGEVSDLSGSSAYIQPTMYMAALQEANARNKEIMAKVKGALVREGEEMSTKQTEMPLPTREYEAKVGPKEPVADATENFDLEDDKTIAQMREEKSDNPSTISFTGYPEQNRHSRSDSKKESPIRFKDAVGRKFNFPFHIAATWPGMRDLIEQAFMNVDVLGPHVMEGHYDLIGPDGEIILPSVWEQVVQPDWAVTMTMWPIWLDIKQLNR